MNFKNLRCLTSIFVSRTVSLPIIFDALLFSIRRSIDQVTRLSAVHSIMKMDFPRFSCEEFNIIAAVGCCCRVSLTVREIEIDEERPRYMYIRTHIFIYICMYVYTYIYIYRHIYIHRHICARERKREIGGGGLVVVEEGIAREGCDYNISPRYCYRSRRSEGICYVHCFSFAPSSKRRSRGPGVPFTVLKGIRAHRLYLFSTLSLFPSLSFPFSSCPFPFSGCPLSASPLPPPREFPSRQHFPGLFYMTISTPKKKGSRYIRYRGERGRENGMRGVC